MSKRRGVFTLFFLTMFSLHAGVAFSQDDASIQTFWAKFRNAVIKGDKQTVAGLTVFPVEMPYGMGKIKTRAQLISRYRTVFNGEANAAKCFRHAKPEPDPQRSTEFTVACDNGSGQEVVIYRFRWIKTGWRFVSLDNINE